MKTPTRNLSRPALLSLALLTSPIAMTGLAATSAPPVPAGGQNTEESLPAAKDLIKKSHDAAGGVDAFKDVKTAQFEVTLSTPQGEQRMTAFTLRPSMIAFEQPTPTGNVVRVYSNGKYAWVQSPQDTGMQIIPANQLGPIQPVLNIQNVFLELTERFKDHRTIEKTEYGGKMAYRVEAVDKLDDSKTSIFFNEEDGSFLGQKVSFATPMGAMEAGTIVTEWEEIDGRKFIRKLDMNLGPQLVTFMISDVEINGVEESMFDLPETVKEQIKAFEEQQKAAEESQSDGNEGDGGTIR